MDQLTPFERDLLNQFNILAAEFGKSQTTFKELSSGLEKPLVRISKRQTQIEERLTKIEADQKLLSDALTNQSKQMEEFVTQVHGLMKKYVK